MGTLIEKNEFELYIQQKLSSKLRLNSHFFEFPCIFQLKFSKKICSF